jgi:hypothetical protein
LIGWIGTLLVIPAAGLTALISKAPVQFILLTFLSGSEAVIIGLFMAALADNKIQGLVYMKGLGVLFFPGALVYFFPSPFFYAAAPIPMFWIMKTGYLLGDSGTAGGFWIHFLAALGIHTGWIIVLIKKYLHKI